MPGSLFQLMHGIDVQCVCISVLETVVAGQQFMTV